MLREQRLGAIIRYDCSRRRFSATDNASGAAVNAVAAQARTERTTNSRTALRSYSLSATVNAGPKRRHRCISYTAPWRQVTQYGSRRSPDRIRIPQPRRSSAVPAASHPYASPSLESFAGKLALCRVPYKCKERVHNRAYGRRTLRCQNDRGQSAAHRMMSSCTKAAAFRRHWMRGEGACHDGRSDQAQNLRRESQAVTRCGARRSAITRRLRCEPRCR
jgi:hypothetical protein